MHVPPEESVMIKTGILPVAVALLVATPCSAQSKVSARPILQAGVTIGGTPIVYPRTDSAEVTALVLEIAPGGETGRHMHPFPTFVYVLEGTFDIEMDDGTVHRYKAGDSYLEAVNTWHNSKNKGAVPSKALIVFAGGRGKPYLVRP